MQPAVSAIATTTQRDCGMELVEETRRRPDPFQLRITATAGHAPSVNARTTEASSATMVVRTSCA
jgi:hypothetical protein